MKEQEMKIAAYSSAFPDFEPLYLSKTGRIEGLWIMGNNYRTSGYYGAYPHGYLARVMSLFPGIAESDIIHVCAGSLPQAEYTRVDKNPLLRPEICCDAEEFSRHITRRYKLALVDVPYSGEDAEHYGFPMLSRKKVLAECYKALLPGGVGRLARPGIANVFETAVVLVTGRRHDQVYKSSRQRRFRLLQARPGMSIESILVKELEREQERSGNLELEVIRLKAQLYAFEPHRYYPPNQNANIADFRRFLKNFNEKSGGKKS